MSSKRLEDWLDGWWAVNANGLKVFQPTADRLGYLACGNLYRTYELAIEAREGKLKANQDNVKAQTCLMNNSFIAKQETKMNTTFQYEPGDKVIWRAKEWEVNKTSNYSVSDYVEICYGDYVEIRYGDYVLPSLIDSKEITPAGETKERFDELNKPKEPKVTQYGRFSIVDGDLRRGYGVSGNYEMIGKVCNSCVEVTVELSRVVTLKEFNDISFLLNLYQRKLENEQ